MVEILGLLAWIAEQVQALKRDVLMGLAALLILAVWLTRRWWVPVVMRWSRTLGTRLRLG